MRTGASEMAHVNDLARGLEDTAKSVGDPEDDFFD